MALMTQAGDTVQELTVEEMRAKYGTLMEISDEENMLLSMGPQHPSTHGVLRLFVELDGERIVNLAPDIGFLQKPVVELVGVGPVAAIDITTFGQTLQVQIRKAETQFGPHAGQTCFLGMILLFLSLEFTHVGLGMAGGNNHGTQRRD